MLLPPNASPVDAPRRVMFYLPELKVGGAEISLLRLAQGLRERGLEVSIVVHRVDQAAHALAGDIELISLDAGRTLAAWLKLPALLRRRRPDVLISALTHSNIVAAIGARLARTGTKVVVTEHAPVSSMLRLDTSRTYRATVKLMPWAYRLADAIVPVSQGIYDDLAPLLDTHTRKRLRIAPNPVLRKDWQQLAQASLDDAWFQADAPPVILAVGRLSPEKNFAGLIKAFAGLRGEAPAPRLAIIGEGPERGALQALIEQYGLTERARLLGQRDNPFAYMRRARVFVLNSLFEGFGNVLIEAMACGVPVISTDCPVGPREVLDQGRYGLLVPADEPRALTAAIDTLLHQSEPFTDASARARQFTVERSVDAYLALFSQL